MRRVKAFANPTDTVRVIVYEAAADNPRHRSDQDFVIEQWGVRHAPSPDRLFARDLWSRMIHTLVHSEETGKYHAHIVDRRGRYYRPSDERNYTLISRTLRAFYGAQYAFPLAVGHDGVYHVAEVDEAIVGVVYSKSTAAEFPSESIAQEMAEWELEEYNQWQAGDVWAVQVHEKHDCLCGGQHPGCTGTEWQLRELFEDDEPTYGLATATYDALSVATEYYGEHFDRLDVTTSA